MSEYDLQVEYEALRVLTLFRVEGGAAQYHRDRAVTELHVWWRKRYGEWPALSARRLAIEVLRLIED